MAKLGARERHGMLGLLLQLGYVPIVTFVIPKSPEQGPRLFCRQNRGPRQVPGLNARVRAGARLFCQENPALRKRILG